MTTLLFQAVRATLVELLADPKYLGAQPGMIAALHTWSQTLVLHPHVHGLVTGGGLNPDGSWKAIQNGLLLPVRVVMAVLRGKLLAAIRQALAGEALVVPEGVRPQQLLNLLTRLGHSRKTKWNVHIRERYRHGAGVVTYLARYLRGGPIKNTRLVTYDGTGVTFTCRPRQEEADGSAASQRMTLPVADFLQRWLLHVPAPQTRVVRSYGLYHPAQAETLAVCRTALGQPPVEVPMALDWQTACAQRGDLHPERCPARVRHEGGTRQEEARQGRDAPADGCGTAGDALLQRVGVFRKLTRAVMGLETALIVSRDGRRPEGARDVTSIA